MERIEDGTIFPGRKTQSMIDSPMPLKASANEKVYLKIVGYSNTTTGTFGVKVQKFDPASATSLIPGAAAVRVAMNLGDMKLFSFDAMAGLTYKVKALSSQTPGVLNDKIQTAISIIISKCSRPVGVKLYSRDLSCNRSMDRHRFNNGESFYCS